MRRAWVVLVRLMRPFMEASAELALVAMVREWLISSRGVEQCRAIMVGHEGVGEKKIIGKDGGMGILAG
jgi:hypothetical protein